ncbi:MAG TPA: MXAN_5187 C-terminal domain-containing protein [Thermoanaerobaculales bacterium]|nr:MXAN_5187 C-terminal domain-containing protein [Thermoanaerobaculales bacterium]HPA81520.1 MXAN_5187 C-terminal domain-containing protein [Thermoanaerobaculales bacterium]HQL28705.1 MXAN_5187 C-terminal domain-containing protein [Thermoanaerobaculales bacterium]HQN95657.1 MXAN_5187 C-terminal domain-containing protein [Thermoanaerobaculales bacterium]HQP44153.1 MXAN_5187 C-terminal domain-containing protein [Thermoanaerobaculales bacterium]
MNLGEQLAMVERAMQALIRDWERFFAGDLRVPPNDDGDRLGRRLRLLAESSGGSRVERFRLEQLQHRFQSYLQNWERMLRDREEGRGRVAGAARTAGAEAPVSPANAAAPGAVDAQEAISLYDRYVAAKRALGLAVGVDRAGFEAQLEAQRQRLLPKLGDDVQFEVLVEDGKVRLAARANRARPGRE